MEGNCIIACSASNIIQLAHLSDHLLRNRVVDCSLYVDEGRHNIRQVLGLGTEKVRQTQSFGKRRERERKEKDNQDGGRESRPRSVWP